MPVSARRPWVGTYVRLHHCRRCYGDDGRYSMQFPAACHVHSTAQHNTNRMAISCMAACILILSSWLVRPCQRIAALSRRPGLHVRLFVLALSCCPARSSNRTGFSSPCSEAQSNISFAGTGSPRAHPPLHLYVLYCTTYAPTGAFILVTSTQRIILLRHHRARPLLLCRQEQWQPEAIHLRYVRVRYHLQKSKWCGVAFTRRRGDQIGEARGSQAAPVLQYKRGLLLVLAATPRAQLFSITSSPIPSYACSTC